jgi:flagellar basal body-associated protein FliL
MARETKAERLAREAAEAAAFAAEQAATYSQRLMALLERAVNANFELTVKDGEFLLEDRDDRRDRTIALTLTYSKANKEALQELDWRVEMKEEAEREALRRVTMRNAALAKLSKEERELLGL